MSPTPPLCYWPDGTLASGFSPCAGVRPVCCQTGDKCLRVDLCRPQGEDVNSHAPVYRGACTDRAGWSSSSSSLSLAAPSCPQYCVHFGAPHLDSMNDTVPIDRCVAGADTDDNKPIHVCRNKVFSGSLGSCEAAAKGWNATVTPAAVDVYQFTGKPESTTR